MRLRKLSWNGQTGLELTQPCVGDVVLLLQVVQNGERLVLEARAEPFCRLRSPADPLTRLRQVGDALYLAVGGAKIIVISFEIMFCLVL